VAHVLTAEQGAAKFRRAAFTALAAARALAPTFEARGFSTLADIAAAPGFEASPRVDIASA